MRSLLYASALLASPALALTTVQYTYDPNAEVDVELVLAVDISQSMDTDEQELQRAGYAAALVSPEFLQAVQYGPIGRIAVAYMEWGGVGEQFIVADWQVVDGPESAAHLAEEILAAPLRQVQRTSIVNALEKSAEMIETNSFQGLRKVIDVSGDGPNNQGGAVTVARDDVKAKGIIINGLPLMMKAERNSWQAMLNLEHYYEDCVIAGNGSFVIPVRSKEEFPEAVRRKLVTEIAGLQPTVVPATGRQPVRCSLFD